MLGENLKYLRKTNSLSQQGLSEIMSIPRTTLGDYERGYTEPNMETLVKFAQYYKVSIDDLLKTKLQYGEGNSPSKGELRILAITTDSEGNENIELVETKAEAGYLDSYSNPEYIKDLPKIKFPNIPVGTYRGFQITGDSMFPMEPGSIIISKFVEKLDDIKDGKTYVVVSKENGVVYKRLRNEKTNQLVHLISDNDSYLPYTISYSEIDEVWEYYAHLSFSDSKDAFDSLIEEKLSDIQRKLTEVHKEILG